MVLREDASRRTFLGWIGLGLSGVVLGCKPDSDSDSEEGDTDTDADSDTDTDTDADTDVEACEPTSRDVEGPYWVEGVPVREELDLYGDVGRRITLDGLLRDVDCLPIAGAVVEIWHCNDAGDYDNDSPDMRYRGQTATASDGTYRFHTVLPGIYPGRPRHIHLKVWVGGVERLTTQIYFEEDAPEALPDDLVVPWVEDGGPDELKSTFEIVV